jgi:hypothetical protein
VVAVNKAQEIRRLKKHLSANRKLALQTLYALALMPRVPEGTSAWFGASAGILAAGPVKTAYPRQDLASGLLVPHRGGIPTRRLGRTIHARTNRGLLSRTRGACRGPDPEPRREI